MGKLRRIMPANVFAEHSSLAKAEWTVFMKCRIIAVLRTRPEAINLAVVLHEWRPHSEEFEIAVVHIAQHRTMLDRVLQFVCLNGRLSD